MILFIVFIGCINVRIVLASQDWGLNHLILGYPLQL